MSRPPGTVGPLRQALVQALRRDGPCGLRELQARSGLSYDDTRTAVLNAVRSGQVVVVGHERPADCKRWANVYGVPDEDAAQVDRAAVDADGLRLPQIMALWHV